MKKLLSRKLWVAVSALGAAVASAATGQVAWPEALPAIAAIVVGYCVSQGWVDGKALEKQLAADSASSEDESGEGES